MLVLARRIGEVVRIGEGIRVVVVAIHGQSVKLGIEAPAATVIRREEIPAEEFRKGKEVEGAD